MKRLLAAFLLLTITSVTYGHAHENYNKNISPYHDALDAQNGVTAVMLTQEKPWLDFIAKYPSWGARFSNYTHLPHRAFGKPISYAAGGNDAVAKAKAFIENELQAYRINTNELVLTRNANDGKYIHVDFKQMHAGKEVLWTRVSVRFSQDLRILLFATDLYKNFTETAPTITSQQAQSYAETAIITSIISSTVEPQLKWFPLPTDAGMQMRLVYTVIVNTQDDAVTPGKYLTYVDASNGAVIYRQNKVVQAGFKVEGGVYPINLQSPAVTQGLPNLKVVVGGTTYYTDATGNVTLPGNGPWNPTISLEGKYSKVVTGNTGNVVAVTSPTNLANGAVFGFPTTITNSSERHINTYYHVNEIHDLMKSKFPLFTTMDNPLTTRIDRTDDNCNAFYNGSSINFYTTANGCNALSYVADVIYHEYGHGISDKFWTANGSSFDNGGMGEGYSDVWAMSIIKNPIIGLGIYTNSASSFIRRYDTPPKVYPTDIEGQVHADGEIIAGAWWDLAVNLAVNMPLNNAIDSMTDIFAGSQFGLATGPDGTEGKVYFDILIDALQYDDVNNDITDGTPHFQDIVKAFARHGIFLLSDSKITTMSGESQVANASFPVYAKVVSSFPAFVGSVKMFYRLRNASLSTVDSMTLTSGNPYYTTNFPSSTAGDIYEYYYTLHDISDIKSAYGPIAPEFGVTSAQRNIPYYFAIGYIPKLTIDFESPLTDWTIGNYTTDNATAGKWIVAVPVPSKIDSYFVQTGADHTTGTGKCAVTANHTSAAGTPGQADLDNGRTTLLTQEFDLSTYTNPVFAYWRWFSNSQSPSSVGRKDRWRTFLIYSGGAPIQYERTYQPDVSWRQNLIPVDLTKGNKVRVMFVAEDSIQNGSGTWVEAAVDDLQILDLGAYPTFVSNINDMPFSVFPNPTINELNINAKYTGPILLTLTDAVGHVVRSVSLDRFDRKYTFNTESLSAGLYMLKCEREGKTEQIKIVKQNN